MIVEIRVVRMRFTGRQLNRATVTADGYVAGVWRPVEGGIAATASHALGEEAWADLATEARALV